MSSVIEFLEQMGRDAQLRRATAPEIEAAMIQAGFEPGLRTAILAEDPRLLESWMGAGHNICCLVNAPDEEPDSEEEGEEEDGDGKEAEDEDEDED